MRVFSILFLVSLTSTALAQPAPDAAPAPPLDGAAGQPPPVMVVPVRRLHRPRIGLEVGGGLWAGNMNCSSENGKCSGLAAAGGASIQGSWFFNPQFGIVADAWVMAHTQNAFTLAQYIATVGIKWRPLPQLTLQAGFGEAHATFSYAGITYGATDSAPAIMGGVSLDLIRGPRWVISAEARFGTGFYPDNNNDGKPDVTARNEAVGAELTFFGF